MPDAVMPDPDPLRQYRFSEPSPALGPGSLAVVLDRVEWHLGQARGEIGTVLAPPQAGETVERFRKVLVALEASVASEVEVVVTVRRVLVRRLDHEQAGDRQGHDTHVRRAAGRRSCGESGESAGDPPEP